MDYKKLIRETIKEALYEPQFPRAAYEQELWPMLEKEILKTYNYEEMAGRIEINLQNGFTLERMVSDIRELFRKMSISDQNEVRKELN